MPQVTIVVATRNRRSRLAETLPRHLRLPDAPEVIVVDSGSHDGTRQLVERARGARLIALDRSRGTAARNVGAACARSPHLAFTDDDAWWEPGALARAAALLDRHPRLAVIQPRVLVGRGRADDPTCTLMATSPLLAAPGQPGRAILSFLACAVVVRRSAFTEVGGFPGRFVVGSEEEIVGRDLETARWQLSYVPEIVAHHDPSASGSRPVRRELEVRRRRLAGRGSQRGPG